MRKIEFCTDSNDKTLTINDNVLENAVYLWLIQKHYSKNL